MKLEKYISDLLYRYDLVIVPDFGGFVTRKKPAHFNEDTYVFSPPYKELSFNAQLQNNDGLLADYVASVEGISYNDAVDKITKWVAKWKQILKEEKRLKLEQIGVFNRVNDENLVFMPLTTRNYLPEAYGLHSFIHRPSIHKQVPVEKSAEKPQKVKPKKTKVAQRKKVSQPLFAHPVWKYAAVAVIGLGLFGAGLTLKRKNKAVAPAETYQKATFVLQKDFPVIQVGDKPQQVAEDSSKSLASKTEADKYFIISGAFRSKANAERKIQELISAGYEAQIVGKNHKGLWMVAYEGFAHREEADQKLPVIQSVQKSAWIYTKN